MIATQAPPARRACVACELMMPPVEDGAPLCAVCAEDRAAARRRVASRIEWTMQPATQAWTAMNRAIDALDEETYARWSRMREAIEQRFAGTADAETIARLDAARAALDRGTNQPLANAWAAYEAHYWARAEATQRAEAVQRRLERLDTWLAKEPTP